MGQYTETYRGCVRAWECDTTEHFTTAFYFERLAQAAYRLLGGRCARTLGFHVLYRREFNRGDVFHIDSGIIRADDTGLLLGHRFVDSATGETCTVGEQLVEAVDGIETAGLSVDWDEPERKVRPPVPDHATWLPTAVDVVLPGEVDWSGGLSLEGMVHRLSTAALQCESYLGLTPALLREERLGFSTFEFQMSFPSPPPTVGEQLEVHSAVAHVGSSSVRMVHRLRRVDGGGEVAILSQMGVNLNLDARRPQALSDEVAARARALLAA